MSDLTIWQKRWHTLDSVLEAMSNRYQHVLQQPDPPERLETLLWLTESLRAFAHSQFEFYYEGFSQSPTLTLEQFEELPVEYVFRSTFDQIAYDIDVIQKAADQRFSPLKIGTPRTIMREALYQADQLAQICLQPAIEANLIEDTTAVIYLQKSPLIRVLPYAPVALIGLPYTFLDTPRDCLALPHEVGHHIYRHGQYITTKLQRVPPAPAWRRRWLEELFADAYGALIAGPVAALSFQDLQFTKTLADFSEDDGDHPVAFLRPELYTLIFDKMGFRFGQSVKELNARWQTMWEQRGRPIAFEPQEDPGTIVSRGEAIELLSEAVDIIFELLKDLPIQNGEQYQLPWSQDSPENSDNSLPFDAALYQNFERFIPSQKIRMPELKGFGDEIGITRDGAKPTVTRKLGTTKGMIRWVEDLKQMRGEGLIMPPALWGAVLSSNGWNIEGPDDPWPPH